MCLLRTFSPKGITYSVRINHYSLILILSNKFSSGKFRFRQLFQRINIFSVTAPHMLFRVISNQVVQQYYHSYACNEAEDNLKAEDDFKNGRKKEYK